LVIFGSIIAYGCYTYAVQTLPLSLVSTYSYVNPVIAVLLGWLILHEQLGWRVLISTAVILLGVIIVKTAPKRTAGAKTRIEKAGPKTRVGKDDQVLPPSDGIVCS